MQFLKRSSKVAVFLLCLVPFLLLAWNAATDNLSANPVDDFTDTTGRWTLRLLLITLAIRPLRQITGRRDLIRFRRMVGLFAFFYGTLHFSTYLVLDHFFNVRTILEDIPQRPFITAGFTAFVAMVPLALTSTRQWIGRLGGRRWQWLHRLIYLSATAGVLHYFWNDKLINPDPLAYGAALLVLLGFRLWMYLRTRRPVVRATGEGSIQRVS